MAKVVTEALQVRLELRPPSTNLQMFRLLTLGRVGVKDEAPRVTGGPALTEMGKPHEEH
mgnify:CR=1 FL=1